MLDSTAQDFRDSRRGLFEPGWGGEIGEMGSGSPEPAIFSATRHVVDLSSRASFFGHDRVFDRSMPANQDLPTNARNMPRPSPCMNTLLAPDDKLTTHALLIARA